MYTAVAGTIPALQDPNAEDEGEEKLVLFKEGATDIVVNAASKVPI